MRFQTTAVRGAGIGLRSNHYQTILQQLPKVAWFEALTENYIGDKAVPLSYLLAIREHYSLTLHGVSLSIGSTDPLNWQYLQQLKELIVLLEPAWVSDHLCWTSVDGRYLPDLLPLPHHREAIQHVVQRVLKVQDFLKQRILLENISRYLEFADSDIPEWEFIAEVAKQADCDILLDLNNLYINSVNHAFSFSAYLKALPKARIKQFHLAGHQNKNTHLLDTHDTFISEAVWDCFREAIALFGPKPALIEWDSHIPSFKTLQSEAEKADSYYQAQEITATLFA